MASIMLGLAITFVCLILAILAREDLSYLTLPRRRVTASVVGFRSDIEQGARTFTPRLVFLDEQGVQVEVLDRLYSMKRTPTEGSQVQVVYPTGHPEKARVPRPLLRLGLYGFAGFLLVALVLRAMGKIS